VTRRYCVTQAIKHPSLMICRVCLLIMVLTTQAWAKQEAHFDFFFQGIYSDKVTLNRAEQIFHEFSDTIQQPVHFSNGPNFEYLERTIETHTPSLIMWGYSDELRSMLLDKGYRMLVSSPLAIHIYQYSHASNTESTPLKAAVLSDSTALYSAEYYYQENPNTVELIPFDNYFLIVEACLRKDVNIVISAKPFLSLQPDTIGKRFTLIETLPEHAKISIWVQSSMSKQQQNLIANYFIDRQGLFKQAFGTGEFKR